MPRVSAGLLIYRRIGDEVQVLLVHPGGPFWKNKDDGAWTIPKGEAAEEEELLDCARREFREELGFDAVGQFIALTPVKQKGGKVVHAWAFEGDCDAAACRSNMLRMEWPPKSKRFVEFPEVDRVAFFDLVAARVKINPAQVALLDELEHLLRRPNQEQEHRR
jgi:predicted NUDIX family NTP pyrophosphohydrolase